MKGKGQHHLKMERPNREALRKAIIEAGKKGILRIELWRKTGIARQHINKHLSRMPNIVEEEDKRIFWEPYHEESLIDRRQLVQRLLERMRLQKEHARIAAENKVIKTLLEIEQARIRSVPCEADPEGDPIIEKAKFLLSIDTRKGRST